MEKMLNTEAENSHARGIMSNQKNDSALPGFVFLDKTTRLPLLKQASSGGSSRSVISLSNPEDLHGDFPLRLPFIQKDSMDDQTVRTTLPFRSTDDPSESPGTFMETHYNEHLQKEARKRVLSRNQDLFQISTLSYHLDPSEQGAIAWSGNPLSPSFASLPFSPRKKSVVVKPTPTRQKAENKAQGEAHSIRSNSNSPVAKIAADGSSSRMASMVESRIESFRKLSHQARAA